MNNDVIIHLVFPLPIRCLFISVVCDPSVFDDGSHSDFHSENFSECELIRAGLSPFHYVCLSFSL